MIFNLPKDYGKLLSHLDSKEGLYRVEKADMKSLPQLRYVHFIFKMVGTEIGYSPDEIKQVYKRKFLTYSKVINEKSYIFTKSLADLKKIEMKEFIDKIRDHASAELGIYVPEPSDRGFDEFYLKFEN